MREKYQSGELSMPLYHRRSGPAPVVLRDESVFPLESITEMFSDSLCSKTSSGRSLNPSNFRNILILKQLNALWWVINIALRKDSVKYLDRRGAPNDPKRGKVLMTKYHVFLYAVLSPNWMVLDLSVFLIKFSFLILKTELENCRDSSSNFGEIGGGHGQRCNHIFARHRQHQRYFSKEFSKFIENPRCPA